MIITKTLEFAQNIQNNWWIKRRWWIISLIGISLFYLELYEDSFKPLDSIHLVEYLLYVVFLIIIGVLITVLTRVLNDQFRNLQILDYKHQIDQEIIMHDDWSVLTHQLLKFPAMIGKIGASSLFMRNPISNQFTLTAQHIESGFSAAENPKDEICSECLDELIESQQLLIQCKTGSCDAGTAAYCLGIEDCEQIHAVLYFRMLPGETLSEEQANILKMINDDLLVALKAGLDRKMLVEMREAEASLRERRKVSHFLHDNLGQNLSFINLKVSQLIAEKDQIDMDVLQNDLKRVREAAGVSHDIVRGIIEENQFNTMPLLSNLLLEHGGRMSQRANFEIVFDIKGEPWEVETELQRAVFYVFQEALSNIEKHAMAKKVLVAIDWTPTNLEICIEDDGLGFQPEHINTGQHFGLSIMQERIHRIDGHIEIISAENAGTVVKICVPISTQEMELMSQN